MRSGSRSHERYPQMPDRGFSLVELLVVIVILGILAGIVVFAADNLTNRARTSACATEKSKIRTALEEYKANTGAYPADGPGAVAALDYLTNSNGAVVPPRVGTLLHSVPENYDVVDGNGIITAIPGNAGDCR